MQISTTMSNLLYDIQRETRLSHPTANHKRIYKLITDLNSQDWKHLLRTETSPKSLLKTLYYNKKYNRKVKDLKNLSNKEIHLTLQSNKLNTTNL